MNQSGGINIPRKRDTEQQMIVRNNNHAEISNLLKSTSLSRRGGLVMQLGMKQMYSGQPKAGPPGWGLAKG